MRLCFFLLIVLLFPRTVFASEQMRINEFLPNPVGDDVVGEWIEMYNPQTLPIDLDGWKVRDVYGVVTEFELDSSLMDTVVESNEYLLLPRSLTHITLNNDSEQLILIDPTGTQTTTDVYQHVEEGKSWSFINGSWAVSTPTPDGSNETVLSPSPSPTVFPSPLPSPTATTSGIIVSAIHDGIAITEVSACTGSTEWVELYSLHTIDVQLTGWLLHDAAGQVKKLDDISILQGKYGVKEWSGTMLNNTGDDVVLLNPQGEVVDSMSYESCDAQTTWVRDGTGWHATGKATKGGQNGVIEQISLPTPTAISQQQLSTPVPRTVVQSETPAVRKKETPLAVFSTPQLSSYKSDIFQSVSNVPMGLKKRPQQQTNTYNVSFFIGGGLLLVASGFFLLGWYNDLYAKNLVVSSSFSPPNPMDDPHLLTFGTAQSAGS